MLSAALEVLAALIAVTLVTAVAVWGCTADRSETPPAPNVPLLVAGGHALFRIPAANTHRRHGRHRVR